MYCKNCGSQIDDNAVICPHCGVATGVPMPVQQPAQKIGRVNGFGIAGFVVSLVSLGLGVYYCIASIVALVLSICGMVARKKCNSCNGLAIAGLVISIISTVVWGIIWIFVFAFIGSLISALSSI